MGRILDEAAAGAWRARSALLWKTAIRYGSSYGVGPMNVGAFGTTFTMFLRSNPGLTDRWDAATSGAVATRFLDPATQGNARLATLYRIVKLGHALAFGSKGHLSAAEVDFIRGMDDHAHDAAPVTGSSRDVANGLAVDFAFRYVGRAAGKRKAVALASRATVFVERVDACETVPYATLRTRLGLEVPFARLGDGWIRPLVAPGGKGFLDEDAFARACAGVEPWADSPFPARLPLGVERACPIAVLEAARPEGHDAAANAARREVEGAACLERAGRLVSVAGVVHVGCPEPVLVPVRTVDRKATEERDSYFTLIVVSVGWASGHVDSETDFGTVLEHMSPLPVWGVSEDGRWPTFPLGHGTMASDVARAYASGIDQPYRAVHHETATTDADPVGAMERALTSMPVSSDEGSKAVPYRNAVLKKLKAGDRKGLRGRSRGEEAYYNYHLLTALAQTSTSALDGKYDVAPSVDDEAEMAALAP